MFRTSSNSMAGKALLAHGTQMFPSRARLRGHAWTMVLLTLAGLMTTFMICLVADDEVGSTRTFRLLTSSKGPRRYAYVFYAANEAYCCAALVNMARLRRFNGSHALPRNVDLVLIVSENVSPRMQTLAQEGWGALVYQTSSFGAENRLINPPLGKFADYYRDSFQKFLAFLLPADVYKRVVVLDADCLILRPPHHLFALPDELPLAAPPAYWYWQRGHFQDTAFWQDTTLRQSRQDFLTTWIMSIRPDHAAYQRLQQGNERLIKQRVQDVYDMDLFNAVFGEEIMALPAEYALLDLELTGVHDMHSVKLDAEEVLNGTRGWAIHFSAGKPMRDAIGPESYPLAHPAYLRIVNTWYWEAADICPPGSYATKTSA